MKLELSSPVTAISHIGRAVEKQFQHLGIMSVRDLIFYFPARYDDLSKITALKDARVGQRVVIRGQLELIAGGRSKFRKKMITTAIVNDGSGSIRVVWFGQPWITKMFKSGDELYLVGEIKEDGSGWYLSSPTYERVSRNAPIHTGRLVPVYPATEKLSQKQIRFLMRAVLPLSRAVPDPLPPEILKQYGLEELTLALSQVHFPAGVAQLEAASRRLKFDELLRLQLFAAISKRELQKIPAPSVAFDEEVTKRFVESLPFKLTDAQRKAAWEIIGDLSGRGNVKLKMQNVKCDTVKPMNRLLEGEVGSGKTVVVAIAALNAVLGVPSPSPSPSGSGGKLKTIAPRPTGEGDRRSGEGRGQVAIMAPTEILARQHFGTFSKMLAPMGVRVGLLTQGNIKFCHLEEPLHQGEDRCGVSLSDEGSPTNVGIAHASGILRPDQSVGTQNDITKREMLKKIREGEIDVIVGTQALLQDTVAFKNLVLAVVDEQHRFGVSQRAALKEKCDDGKMPHLLTLTATPIPRSLALVFYGDLDISILKEMPQGRQRIKTVLVESAPPLTLSEPAFMKALPGMPSWRPPRQGGETNQFPPLAEGGEAGTSERSPRGSGGVWIRDQVYDFVRAEVKVGHQVFWTCPIIDPSDTLGVQAATEVFEHLRTEIFSDLRVGLLHGRMKSKEREKVMGEFLAKNTDILVATPVIEVGIDVPNATVMVIEGSERFGLAQLHQFRGRVGRGTAQSYCLLMVEDTMRHPEQHVGSALVADRGTLSVPESHVQRGGGGQAPTLRSPQNDRVGARIQAFLECENGFELAERDLALRGPGEIYSGTAQSGFPEFKMASLADVEIAKEAKIAAQTLLQEDPELLRYPVLKQAMASREGRAHLE